MIILIENKPSEGFLGFVTLISKDKSTTNCNVDKNNIKQYFATHIVHGCQLILKQYCSA